MDIFWNPGNFLSKKKWVPFWGMSQSRHFACGVIWFRKFPSWPGRCLWSMFVMDTRSSGTTAQAQNGDGNVWMGGRKYTSVGRATMNMSFKHPWRKFKSKISFCKTLFLVLAVNCKLQVKKRGICPNESFLESLVPRNVWWTLGGIAPFDDKHSGQAGESLVIFFNVKKDS